MGSYQRAEFTETFLVQRLQQVIYVLKLYPKSFYRTQIHKTVWFLFISSLVQ